MSQVWHILSVTQRLHMAPVNYNLGQFFFTNMPHIYDSLRYPCLPKQFDKWLSRGSMAFQPGPMGKLPVEVFNMIFEELIEAGKLKPNNGVWDTASLLEVVALSVTCKLLLSVGKSYIQKCLIRAYAIHVRSRMVCIGDNSLDVPPRMLTAAEYKKVENTALEWRDSPADRRFPRFASKRYHGTRGTYTSLFAYDRLVKQRLPPYSKQLLQNLRSENPREALDIEMILSLVGSDPMFPLCYPDGPNVLCNHIKREYVREDALVVLENSKCRVTLVQALLSQICWSSDPKFSMAIQNDEKYSELLSRGPWAGHRFQIVSAEEFEPGTRWKDVTEKVNDILRHMWEAEYGEGM